MNDKQNIITVSAPGKIHLMGEHAVVYGKPALLTTIDKRCTVTLTPSKNHEVVITAKNLNWTKTFLPEEILSFTTDELHSPLIAISETLLYYQKNLPGGFHLTIDSDIPVGSGLGSSAALAVSIAAAVTLYLGINVDNAVINEIAFLIEQKTHGTASGGDNAAVCFGGMIWFRKESPELKIIQPIHFTIPKVIANNVILIDTGRPAESTGEMVRLVKNFKKEKSKVFNKFLNDQEILTRDIVSAIKENNENDIIKIIKKGEKNLEKIGVVSSSAKTLIRTIEHSGGAAKISGAGGRKKGSGMILAYHPDRSVIQTLARRSLMTYYSVKLGSEGLTIS